ncbi:unnamed protein product [Medioppia subpectinata]|uniref:Major facilitator superfamily (MFS) profile domain-containing protein n=1 Tax=Medioppia subpectinata TaxID=1979941 RepID=A0A7R9PTS7_9ACAR|nr:unnamed protein product [Medioppia subpectinata]CAG2100449.1 unnamed protein product [Medioppia subpectinata]
MQILVGGYVFNYINRQLVLAFHLFVMAVTVAVIPICPNLRVLFTVLGICGFSSGGFEIAIIVWIVELWNQKSSLYLGGAQLFFAIGNCIAPLISAPFLTNINTNYVSINSTTIINPTIVNIKRLEVPFIINAVFLLISSLLLIILHFYRKYIPPIKVEKEISFTQSKKWDCIYLTLGIFVIGPFVGLEIMNFQLIPTFLSDSYQPMSASKSSLMLGLLNGVFAIFCLINFVVAIKFWTKNYIYVNLILVIVSNILLFVYQYYEYSERLLMAGIVIMGIGFSTTYPSIYTFFESNLTLDNTTTSIFISATGIMIAVFPVKMLEQIDWSHDCSRVDGGVGGAAMVFGRGDGND